MKESYKKLKALKEYIHSLGSVAIAYSGGVDSTFLLKVAQEVIGNKVIAITAHSASYPERELKESRIYAESINIKQIIFESNEINNEEYAKNTPDRCYICKNILFKKIIDIANEHGIKHIAEGSNIDDNNDYRPGQKAIKELKILSPLKQVGMTKDEIRTLSKELGLPTWEKQSFACLSSRFPYGNPITEEKLKMVDKAEQLLLNININQVRVRYHDDVARIEINQQFFSRFMDEELREYVYSEFKKIGFTYVALDLRGYRMGSMNESL